MLESLVIAGVAFVAGSFIRPLIDGYARKLGQKLKSEERRILAGVKDPIIKEAAINFMKELNKTMTSEQGEARMDATVNFITGIIIKAIPGPVDDAIVPSVIRPFLQGLYNGYIKS